MNIKITSNEELFKKWKELSIKIELMKSIVQNDFVLEDYKYLENFDSWRKISKELEKELHNLISETELHCHNKNCTIYK